MRRCVFLEAAGQVGAYLHGTRIGALVALEGGDAALGHDLAMHVAASNPQYLSTGDVPADVMAKEREIETEKAKGEGKPAEIVAKMVEGRLRKSLGEITLLGQPFVKDPDQSVEKLLKAAKATRAELPALRGRRRHREEAGRLRRRGHGAGQGQLRQQRSQMSLRPVLPENPAPAGFSSNGRADTLVGAIGDIG